jgi:hypothetical protein
MSSWDIFKLDLEKAVSTQPSASTSGGYSLSPQARAAETHFKQQEAQIKADEQPKISFERKGSSVPTSWDIKPFKQQQTAKQLAQTKWSQAMDVAAAKRAKNPPTISTAKGTPYKTGKTYTKPEGRYKGVLGTGVGVGARSWFDKKGKLDLGTALGDIAATATEYAGGGAVAKTALKGAGWVGVAGFNRLPLGVQNYLKDKPLSWAAKGGNYLLDKLRKHGLLSPKETARIRPAATGGGKTEAAMKPAKRRVTVVEPKATGTGSTQDVPTARRGKTISPGEGTLPAQSLTGPQQQGGVASLTPSRSPPRGTIAGGGKSPEHYKPPPQALWQRGQRYQTGEFTPVRGQTVARTPSGIPMTLRPPADVTRDRLEVLTKKNLMGVDLQKLGLFPTELKRSRVIPSRIYAKLHRQAVKETKRTPDTPATKWDATYKDKLMDKLANYIRKKGLGRDFAKWMGQSSLHKSWQLTLDTMKSLSGVDWLYLGEEDQMSNWDIFKGHSCKGCPKCNGAHEGKPHDHDDDEKSSYWDIFKGMDPSLSGATGTPSVGAAPKGHDLGTFPKPKMYSQPTQSPAQTSIPIHTENAAHTQKHMNLLQVDNKPISSSNPYPTNSEEVKKRVSVAGAGEMHTLSDGTKVQRHGAYHEPSRTFVVSHSIPKKGDTTKHSQEDVGEPGWPSATFHGKDRKYHGPHQVYHGGVLHEHMNIANGKREGPRYMFHRDGKLLSVRNHKDGVIAGHTDPMKTYKTHPRGILHSGDLTLPHPSEYAALKTPGAGLSTKARKKMELFRERTRPRMKKSMSQWDIFRY